MDLLREGARSDAQPERTWAVAEAVWDLMAPGYGPGGGHKLVDGELAKASVALRAVPGGPDLRPYQELAADAGRYGHHACLAVLVAAATVRRAFAQPRRHLPALLEGIRLARRQADTWLDAHAEAATPAEAMADADPLLPGHLVDGLEALVVEGDVQLDRIAVVAADAPHAAWAQGIPMEVAGTPAPEVRILVVEEVALPRPRTESSLHLSRADDASRWEDAVIGALRRRVAELQVGLLVCRKGLPEDLASRLHLDGVATCSDAAANLVHRIALATGARPTASLQTAEPSDLGHGRLRRRIRRGDFVLAGDGPTATLEVPGIGPARELAEAAGEAWLRTVAPVWQDSRTIPGGGRWQRDLAAHLRSVAPHAPRKAPLGIAVAARALEDVASSLVRNLGHDPSRTPSIDGIVDPVACVRPALLAGWDLAHLLLRIDARHEKRSSRPVDLRGNLGPSGSLKGMPGDIPPLM